MGPAIAREEGSPVKHWTKADSPSLYPWEVLSCQVRCPLSFWKCIALQQKPRSWWRIDRLALKLFPPPVFLAKLTPVLLAGSQQLPPRPALASGSPRSSGLGSCSSATRSGEPSLPTGCKNSAETPRQSRTWFSIHLQPGGFWGLDAQTPPRP